MIGKSIVSIDVISLLQVGGLIVLLVNTYALDPFIGAGSFIIPTAFPLHFEGNLSPIWLTSICFQYIIHKTKPNRSTYQLLFLVFLLLRKNGRASYRKILKYFDSHFLTLKIYSALYALEFKEDEQTLWIVS